MDNKKDKESQNIIINTENMHIECIKLQKMIFLYNAVEDGWKVKKSNDCYIFSKNHEGKKEIFLDSYLKSFVMENIDSKKFL